MVLPESLILMATKILRLLSGTKKSASPGPLHDSYCIVQAIQGLILLTVSSDFLKERLFGLSNPQGNHGESVKEAHFHVDNTPVSELCNPSHSDPS